MTLAFVLAAVRNVLFYSDELAVLSESAMQGAITFFIVIHPVNSIKTIRQNRNRYRPSAVMFETSCRPLNDVQFLESDLFEFYSL